MDNGVALLSNLDSLHTTELGAVRIKKNLGIETDDVVSWCIAKISDTACQITRKGKNWYAATDNCIITINAYSFTIITARIIK